jgi:NTE family protein
VAESIGLVLAGGGARGAYEVGVLRALLPWLEGEHGQRPDLFVGTSVGALNAAFLAANADKSAAELADEGRERWLDIDYRRVLEPFLSPGELVTATRLALSLVVREVVPLSLLDPAPLRRTLADMISFGDIRRNREQGALRVCAVVATAAHTNRSVVFHDGGPDPPSDDRRGIDYVATEIGEDHVLASAAIPVVFPAVHVREPKPQAGWYFDGGTRLNTPIKPAVALGANRVIVIGLNSLTPATGTPRRADLFDGASHVIQGLLVDPVINDVETLAQTNQSPGPDRPVVPYIFIAPRTPNAVGKIARDTYGRSYSGLRGLLRSSDLSLLGRLIGAGRSSTRGELFSFLFFAREFTARLLRLGQEDGKRWIEERHDDGAWQVGPLPQGSNARRRTSRSAR